jgi:hypothetical protein
MLKEVDSLKSSIKDTAAKLALTASRTALSTVGVLGQKALDNAMNKAQRTIEKRIYGGGDDDMDDGDGLEYDTDAVVGGDDTNDGDRSVKHQMGVVEFCVMMLVLALIVTLIVIYIASKFECPACAPCDCSESVDV